MRVIAVIDGEHEPDVTRWALASARGAGWEVVEAWVAGGGEKLRSHASLLDLGGMPVEASAPGSDLMEDLRRRIERVKPQGVLDLSDEPVLGHETRMELAAVALSMGIPYLGPGFRFDPPVAGPPLPVPSVAVIGTGKRVGKTAVSAHLARLSAAAGERPVVVATGRGGPPRPEVASPDEVTLEALLARAERGEHAASDFLEDALVAGVSTVGARRAGGGLTGRPFVTTVAEAAARAVELGADPLVLEGSGASLPTMPWDAGVLVVPGGLPPPGQAGSLWPLGVLLSDLVVSIIDASGPYGPDDHSTLEPRVRRLRPGIRVAFAELSPVPLADVRDRDVFFATTAQPGLAERLVLDLEASARCRVVKVSTSLSDRTALSEDLHESPPFDVLLTELKGAAVDVAARRARERGAEVVFVEHRPRSAKWPSGDGELDALLREVTALARARHAGRAGEGIG